ncbi:MAG TPA: hypothetical protein PLR50_12595 [Candidatus Rifleibacterium sp.]|nr:hypothetical protein [Candidatus Rifleibacterium sp.]
MAEFENTTASIVIETSAAGSLSFIVIEIAAAGFLSFNVTQPLINNRLV